jgi:hypothetical protein
LFGGSPDLLRILTERVNPDGGTVPQNHHHREQLPASNGLEKQLRALDIVA